LFDKIYVIRKGDTLRDIAFREFGYPDLWIEIMEYNNRRENCHITGTKLLNPSQLKIGQKILIPSKPSFARQYSLFNPLDFRGQSSSFTTSDVSYLCSKAYRYSLEVEARKQANLSDFEYNQKYATIMSKLVGKLYVSGHNGPNSFDCSGAACFGIRETANINFGDYSADQLYKQFTFPTLTLEAGCVIFYDYTGDGKIEHVTSLTNANQMVHPSSGAGLIELRPIGFLDSYTTQKEGKIYKARWNWSKIKDAQ